MAPCVQPAPQGATLTLHVQPRASRNELVGLQGGALKVRLTSPPVEGAANELCREFLAKVLAVPRSTVSLVAGEKSRHKRLLIAGLTADELRSRLLAVLG